MKTSLTKLKSSLVLLTLGFTIPLWASPVARITELNGQVFLITPEGKTTSVKINDHLEERSEIMVEEGATITLNDFYDATYHLTGGSHMKFFKKSVQLKRGKTWVQSQNPAHSLALTTANGHVDFSKGEFITTFDQTSSRSQVLVVNGDVEVSNVLDRNMKFTVSAGTFTLVDPEVENGVPRSPTKVGLVSLNEALAEFKQLPEKMIAAKTANETPQRSIASVADAQAPKKGEIIFISTNRLPASVNGGAHAYYSKKVKKTAVSKSTFVPIKFYGMTPPSTTSVFAPRGPASVPVKRAMPSSALEKVNTDSEFSDSLKKQEGLQPKHSKELENLIQDLKSY